MIFTMILKTDMKKWINYFFYIIFYFVFIYEIWHKFVKNKLSKEIPLNLTLFSLSVLLVICIILLITIVNLLLTKTSHFFIDFKRISFDLRYINIYSIVYTRF